VICARGGMVGVQVGVGMDSGFSRVAALEVEGGVRSVAYLPHRSLSQAERIIPIARNRAKTLPVCGQVDFISGKLYPSSQCTRMRAG
jgi:hypothetical protein